MKKIIINVVLAVLFVITAVLLPTIGWIG